MVKAISITIKFLKQYNITLQTATISPLLKTNKSRYHAISKYSDHLKATTHIQIHLLLETI